MNQIARLLDANDAYASARAHAADSRPSRRLAVLTCMDGRIDVFAALGLHIGEAHVLRNAGGRVTDDVLRSLALSTHVLGVDTLVIMQHTGCGLAGVTDEELQRRTGADLGFYPIDDHAKALREDIAIVSSQSFLGPLQLVAGFVYDVETGGVADVARWERPE
ncbi:MAG: carbonic anhydrase [Actinomycetia bacterium]|nr:carbonic anhydrase [Actinomycetes bacterium]